jgi:hypothetical protein
VVAFRPLRNKIRPEDHIDTLRPFLPAQYSPLQPKGNGFQTVYLAEFPADFGESLLTLCSIPCRSRNQNSAADSELARASILGNGAQWRATECNNRNAESTVYRGAQPSATIVIGSNPLAPSLDSLKVANFLEGGRGRILIRYELPERSAPRRLAPPLRSRRSRPSSQSPASPGRPKNVRYDKPVPASPPRNTSCASHPCRPAATVESNDRNNATRGLVRGSCGDQRDVNRYVSRAVSLWRSVGLRNRPKEESKGRRSAGRPPR